MNGIIYMNVNILKNESIYRKCISLVSEDRKQKIMKFKNPVPARLSLGAGILLRILLDQQKLGHLIDKIAYEEHGKPYIKDIDFHFNLSHSGEYVICAYSNTPLGIDLQKINDAMPKSTKKILGNKENLFLNSLNEEDKIQSFYRIWSRKESLIKYDGRGLSIPLTELPVTTPKEFKETIIFESQKLYFNEFSFLMPEYTICICSRSTFITDNIFEIKETFLIKY